MNWNLLKGAVVSRGMNMQDLAEQTGIDNVSLWRRYKAGKVTVLDVKKIKDALHLTNDEVLNIFF